MQRIETKICNKCKQKKSLDEFRKQYNSTYKKYYTRGECKLCASTYNREYDRKNRKKVTENHRKYVQKNKDKIKAINKKAHKKWYEKNKEKKNKQNKEWYEKNKEKVKEYKRNYSKEYYQNMDHLLHRRIVRKKYHQKENCAERINLRIRYRTDIQYNIKRKLRSRLNSILKGITKNETTEKLIGCTFEYFKKYIELLFIDGMTWYHLLNGKIHIDHIIPLSKFDLTDINQQKKAMHYTNMQPLWAKDNYAKGDKIL